MSKANLLFFCSAPLLDQPAAPASMEVGADNETTPATKAADAQSTQIIAEFKPLIKALKAQNAEGVTRPLRSHIGFIVGRGSWEAKYASFKDYTVAAQSRGFVKLGEGEKQGKEWVALRWPGVKKAGL